MAELDRDKEDPKASSTVIVAVIGALIVFVLIVALQAYFYNAEETEREGKVYAEVPQELAGLRAQQVEQLNSYHWVDQSKGTVAIPIERALELTVRDQGVLPFSPVTQAPTAPAPAGQKLATPKPASSKPGAANPAAPKPAAPARPSRKK